MHDPPLPIESRMLQSIEATFDRAGVNPAGIKAGEWRWLSSAQKAREVGLEALYEFAFRVASHSVHGTWHDLEFYHLELVDGEYHPAIRFHRPRPQVLELATVACLDTAEKYLQAVVDGEDIAAILERIQSLRDWFRQMAIRHEETLRNA